MPSILLNIVLLIFHVFLYYVCPVGHFDRKTVVLSAILVLIAFIFNIHQRNKTLLKKYNFSIIFIYFIMSFIISYQIPIEISFGNKNLLNTFFIFDIGIINKMVAFSGICFNAFFLGATIIYQKNQTSHKNSNSIQIKANTYNKINTKPLLIILLFFFILFFLTINRDYVARGHGSVAANELALSFYGIFMRLSIIYVSFIVANNINKNINSIKNFISIFNPFYLCAFIAAILLFLSAGTRVYIIYLFSPILFAFFLLTKRKIKLISIFILFFGMSVFATFFKIYGIESFFSSNLSIEGYIISELYFPFTGELASSIYSQSLLFYEWFYNDFTLYGSTFLVGFFRTIPGLMSFLEVPQSFYDTGIIATRISGFDYGVGTTSLVDSLINLGFFGAILLFVIIGIIFSYVELKIYNGLNSSLPNYVVYLSICAFIFFVPRASMGDMLGTILFGVIFAKVYCLIIQKK